ncbi:MAG: DUF948 domain-containing protein [Nitrospirota bacterium]
MDPNLLNIGFIILILGVLAALGVLIYAVMEIRRLAVTLNEFIKGTEEKLYPVLEETELSLRSFRKISDDASRVTENIRNLSDAAQDIVTNVRALSSVVNYVGEGASMRVSGVKAGLKTALSVLIRQIRERRI